MPMARSSTTDHVFAELVVIKRLLVLGLLRSGASQKEVASALGGGSESGEPHVPGWPWQGGA